MEDGDAFFTAAGAALDALHRCHTAAAKAEPFGRCEAQATALMRVAAADRCAAYAARAQHCVVRANEAVAGGRGGITIAPRGAAVEDLAAVGSVTGGPRGAPPPPDVAFAADPLDSAEPRRTSAPSAPLATARAGAPPHDACAGLLADFRGCAAKAVSATRLGQGNAHVGHGVTPMLGGDEWLARVVTALPSARPLLLKPAWK